MMADITAALIERHREDAVREALQIHADDIARAQASGCGAQMLAVRHLVWLTGMRILNQRVTAGELAWHRAAAPLASH